MHPEAVIEAYRQNSRGNPMQRPAYADILQRKLRPPLAIVLGAPREVTHLLAELDTTEVTCYQMDLYQADRLRAELAQASVAAQVAASADLWDLPPVFQTVLYPAPRGGERSLKIDMVEQAFHVLRPHGLLLVLSPFANDLLFPELLKKVFGTVHATAVGRETVFWCHREGERPRRRHEVFFQVRVNEGESLRFLSRPGVFAYGRFDAGARALIEVMRIDAGDSILDLGSGCGTNGIIAGRRSGPTGRILAVDSNLRAVALTEHNARADGLLHLQALGSDLKDRLPQGPFDVALTNPPYYAQGTIAQLFIERAREVLKPGGRFYLVTKQADQIGPLVADSFGRTEAVARRGYVILCATVAARSTKPAVPSECRPRQI
jgi:16S rRNA G1207 methylase RsmC